MAPTATHECAHCGLPVPAQNHPDQGPAFCCRGCATVWSLVHEAGLENYYELRTRLGEDAPGRARANEAARRSSYAHLDDPEILAQLRVEGREGSARLRCTGMHCAACVWLIERLPQTLDGLEHARVELGSGQIQLDWDPERVSLSRIAARLHEAGYELHRLDVEAERARLDTRRRELVRLAVTGASAGNVMLVSFALYAGALSSMEPVWTRFFEWAALILALPAVTYGAAPFYRGAWAGLRARSLHIDLPVALGVLGGFGASALSSAGLLAGGGVYFDTVCVLVFLLLIGRRIQAQGQHWALSRTDLLRMLVPERARRLDVEGRAHECAAASLRPGERIEVRTGERVPADACLLRGQGSVDTSSLTGEAKPTRIEQGDLVLAGSTLVEGELELEVRAVGAKTRVGALAAEIMAAGRERAPIQRAVDRISGMFVAAVLLLALVGAVVWSQLEPARAFAVVVSLLVISCPCALGLATPVALALARAQAAQRGILVASAGALEDLARARRIVLDKTGTLTRGEPSVRRLVWADAPGDETQLAALLLGLEAGSGHPLAQALRRWASTRATAAAPIDALEERPGCGREGRYMKCGQPMQLRVGSPAWITATSSLGDALGLELEAMTTRGLTPVLVEFDGQVRALFGLEDTLHADAKPSLERLRELGIELAVRSGDHPAAVARLARELSIEDYAGALTPEQKARELAASDALTVMVGDGINDAAAMRRASVGVAVSGGAEVALRSADVHLAGEGLAPLVELVEGSRRTMALIHRNLAFSLAYNLVFASLALAGQIDPLAAALLMPASSLTVVLSSTLTRSFTAPAPSERAPSSQLSRPAQVPLSPA